MHDNDIGEPDPLRLKVFGHDPGIAPAERLEYLIEFVTKLDDRLKELEQAFTAYVTRDIDNEEEP
jgi:hypothetical protein